MSHKVIRILNGIASISSDDGTFFDVPVSELDFEPKVGDDVQCFRNGENVIVVKENSDLRSKAEMSPEPQKKDNACCSENMETSLNGMDSSVENIFCESNSPRKSKGLFVGFAFVAVVIGCIWMYFPSVHYEVMTDPRDGKTYKTVKIGSQIWMAENLDFDVKIYSNSAGADKQSGEKLGRFYSWKQAVAACPPGWHLPSNDEYYELVGYIGSEAANVSKNGKKLMSRSWGGSNKTGFSALPAGYTCVHSYKWSRWGQTRLKKPEWDDKIYSQGAKANFWTSSFSSDCPYEGECAFISGLGGNVEIDSTGSVQIYDGSRGDSCFDEAYSVRCVKDEK